ncbi:hypothetical protein [Castellaniella sp.]|uniref:hypothetical protein n=1 Tax=Castellaniella sp. TaxID=1955812 RepID=UPI002AFF0FEF|nr:hypothetical protein [Castellaniella sp.]
MIMNLRPLYVAAITALTLLSLPATAQVSKAELETISMSDRVNTAIDELRFFDGVPSDTTIDKLYGTQTRSLLQTSQTFPTVGS